MEPIRINKYLANHGIASRRAIERMIEEQKILVNGAHAILGQKVSDDDKIIVDGKRFKPQSVEEIVLIFHKPKGVTSTTVPDNKDKTLADYKFGSQRVYPVGRLDKNSRGLMLLTNDGDLANTLTHPRYEHEKEYIVSVDLIITDQMLKRLSNGSIKIDGKPVNPATVVKRSEKSFSITLKEGRNKQIRRMCDTLGLTVTDLKRVRIATIELGDLPSGSHKPISTESLKKLKN